MKKEKNKEILLVATISLIVNTLLTLGLFFAGKFGNAPVLINDSLFALSGVVFAFLLIIGVLISNKLTKKNFNKLNTYENIVAIILAILLVLNAIFVCYNATIRLINYETHHATLIAILASCVSLVVKGYMYHHVMHHANKLKSSILKADAWHHLTEGVVAIGSLLAVLGSIIGLNYISEIVSYLIALLLVYVAITIVIDAIDNTNAFTDIKNDTYKLLTKNNIEYIQVDVLKFSRQIYVIIDFKNNEPTEIKNIIKNKLLSYNYKIHDVIFE